jgi:hypothetical protein
MNRSWDQTPAPFALFSNQPTADPLVEKEVRASKRCLNAIMETNAALVKSQLALTATERVSDHIRLH